MSHDDTPGHGRVLLALLQETPDGGRVAASWTICECTADTMRARLGPPQQESVTSAEAVRSMAEFALNLPGAVHDLGEEPPRGRND